LVLLSRKKDRPTKACGKVSLFNGRIWLAWFIGMPRGWLYGPQLPTFVAKNVIFNNLSLSAPFQPPTIAFLGTPVVLVVLSVKNREA